MTAEPGVEPALRTYLLALRRRQWWVVSFTLLGLVASVAFSLTSPKRYSATAQILVQSSTSPVTPGAAPQPVTATDIQTELELVTSAPVQSLVKRRLGSLPPVSVAEVGQTNVIAITATSRVPSRAALVANTYAQAFVQYRQTVASRTLTAAEAQMRSQIASLTKQIDALRGSSGAADQQSGSGTSSSAEVAALLNQEAVLKEQLAQMEVSGAVDVNDVELVTPAQVPTSPSSPTVLHDGLLGVAAGLVCGLGVAFLRDNLDDRLSSKAMTEEAAGVTVLTAVPMVTSWRRRRDPLIVADIQPSSPAAEAYRALRTSLQFARQERRLRSLVVTSPAASEGKTSTVANMGVVFAEAGERVALVSCDLRRPRLGRFFGLDERVGLMTVLAGQCSLQEALQPVAGHERLWILASGPVPPHPAEALNSAGVSGVLDRLRDSFDVVLIDSPPVLPVTDAVMLSRHADATLVVVAAGRTRRTQLRLTMEKLNQVDAPVVGIMLNQVTRTTDYGYSTSYRYRYHPAHVASSNGGPRPHGQVSVAGSGEPLRDG